MKKVMAALLLAGLVVMVAGCDLSIKNTDGPDPVKLGENIKYRLDADVQETTDEETTMMSSQDSGTSEEEAKAAINRFFDGSSSKARQFFPIQPLQEEDQTFPIAIIQDAYPPSVNPVSVRPKGGNASNAVCGFARDLRVVFCAFNPMVEPEDYPVIEVTVNTRKAGKVKNTAKINLGQIAFSDSPDDESYIVENENRPGYPAYLPKSEYDDPDVENNTAVAITTVVAPPKKP